MHTPTWVEFAEATVRLKVTRARSNIVWTNSVLVSCADVGRL